VTVKKLFVSSFLACGLASPTVVFSEEKPPVRVYTNDDLDRVAPYRAQTGVASVPAVSASAAAEGRSSRSSVRGGKAEAYWHREAERVRTRVRGLEARAAEIRLRLQEERQRPVVFGRGHTGQPKHPSAAPALQAKLEAVEREIRAVQDELDDRARREGAMPGWLR
jgi:hypothetical protein